jgi:hypothetical protein
MLRVGWLFCAPKGAFGKQQMQRHECEINLALGRVQFRALTKVATEFISETAYEIEGANLLLQVALANIHLLRPHIRSMRAYCAREGVSEAVILEQAISAQFLSKKGKRK